MNYGKTNATKQGVTMILIAIEGNKVTFKANNGRTTHVVLRSHETTYEEYFVSKNVQWHLSEFVK